MHCTSQTTASISTEFFSAVSVVSISTFSFNKVGLFLVAAIVNYLGSSLSHLGQRVLIQKSAVGAEVGEASLLCTSCFSILACTSASSSSVVRAHMSNRKGQSRTLWPGLPHQ